MKARPKNYTLDDICDMHRSLANIREVKAMREVNKNKQEVLSVWDS